MARDVITIHGEPRVVREDTAKSYRGVMWALISIAAFVAIVAALFFGGFLTSLLHNEADNPPVIERGR